MTGHNKETSWWRGSIKCKTSHAQLTRRGQLVSHESSSETGSRERVREGSVVQGRALLWGRRAWGEDSGPNLLLLVAVLRDSNGWTEIRVWVHSY